MSWVIQPELAQISGMKVSFKFVDALFPWFDTVPGFNNLNGLEVVERYNLVSQYPLLAEKAAELNASHLIVINGRTDEDDITSGSHAKNWGGCVTYVCLGMQYADKTSKLWAEVLDLRVSGLIQAQSLEHTVTDEIVWPLILIPTVPIIPNTKAEVCEVLGHAIAEQVLGGGLINSE